jgi:hypothetical protein
MLESLNVFQVLIFVFEFHLSLCFSYICLAEHETDRFEVRMFRRLAWYAFRWCKVKIPSRTAISSVISGGFDENGSIYRDSPLLCAGATKKLRFSQKTDASLAMRSGLCSEYYIIPMASASCRCNGFAHFAAPDTFCEGKSCCFR